MPARIVQKGLTFQVFHKNQVVFESNDYRDAENVAREINVK